MRRGYYVVYNGKEYFWSINGKNDKILKIKSFNQEDLNNGFTQLIEDITIEDGKKYVYRYDYFVCEKNIKRNEATELFEIVHQAFYKGEQYCVMGGRAGHIALSKDIPFYLPNIELENWRKKMENIGFESHNDWHGPLNYIGSIPLDDPDLQIIEERVDIPI
ncbi:hypothetical protein FACS1894132_11730 [Clostridia bacterium]|nr:hypothetical protein FACS1894132_11730 [Clostridia bacterium]